MKKFLVGLLFSVLLALLVACGGSSETPELVTFRAGDPWSFRIGNCPQGSSVTIYSDVLSVSSEGVDLLGQEQLLDVGDEVTHILDCGNGQEVFAFAKIHSIDVESRTVTVERYSKPMLR